MRGALTVLVLAWSTAALADPVPPPTCTDVTAAAACSAAIDAEKDDQAKSDLLSRRAYARDTAQGPAAFRDTLGDLDLALKLNPSNVDALHERAYIDNEIGRWKQAESDLGTAIALLPNEASGYSERALSRFNLGELQGVLDDRNAEVRLRPTASAFLSRARAHMWLGQFDAAEQDIAEGRKRAGGDAVVLSGAGVISAQLTFWRSTSPAGAQACTPATHAMDYNSSFLIGDCTRAFLDATAGKDKAAALSARSLAWITGANDVTGFVDDSRIAVALDPGDPNLRSNLGFAYMRLDRPGAAIEQFNAAISIVPGFANFAGRAQAKLAVGDLDGAAADANASAELEPNRIALTVLGDVAYAQTKTFDKSKDYWLKAYNSGPPDDGLIRRLKAAGVAIPDAAPQPAPARAPQSTP